MANEYHFTLGGVEAFNTGVPAADVTTLAAEAFNSGAAAAQLTTYGLEAFHTGISFARITDLALEVFRSLTTVPSSHKHISVIW